MANAYRGMDRAALDKAYNNRNAVADYAAIAADRKARSDRVRDARQFHADLRYGDSPRERLDFFPAEAPPAPVLVFIHGGYWQSNDKEASSFLVEGPLARGFSVALVEYTLAPEAAIERIVAETKRAVEWLARNASRLGGRADRIVVSGHSAGGHLAATLLDHPAVCATLPISGLFDLEPIRLNYLNENLKLTQDSAERNSPIRHVPPSCAPSIVAVGAAELPELVRQSADYAAALRAAKLPAEYLPLAGHDHFSVLEELAAPDAKLCEALARLCPEARAG
jgi:acetyl esterase/lipase